MKAIIMKVLPLFMVNLFRSLYRVSYLFIYYINDFFSYLRYSSIIDESNSQKKLSARISLAYHSIEKGLTMPDRRLGFGKYSILRTISLCEAYIKENYDISDNQFLHALGVLDEYNRLHQDNSFILEPIVTKRLDDLLRQGYTFPQTQQINTTKVNYFKEADSSFDKFSASRYSLRNFEKGVEIDRIEKAVKLAQRAPSSCNRQPSRIYIIDDRSILKEVLFLQQGSRGFGHLADKIIVLTVDIGAYASPTERNAAYVDGGMYGMNLLYSLHFQKIGTCTLNCNFSTKTATKIRKSCGISKSEVFAMIILIGNLPENFQLALSQRQEIKNILKII